MHLDGAPFEWIAIWMDKDEIDLPDIFAIGLFASRLVYEVDVITSDWSGSYSPEKRDLFNDDRVVGPN
ncbi:hypothetical protein BC374_17570 [Ensifer sp. LC13]|nr:hypothetical protein BC362_10395 [Ensifer sp. LC14]OCP10879.1 hypothetical protein BC374_17570 [Ensifer sp. LC13]OCP11575.1 hypothetical protein BBX50_18285 [Ensifer sp. LC11]OCP33394.1 hypothetical protein BC364_17175 [Ensifer sp. LC499]